MTTMSFDPCYNMFEERYNSVSMFHSSGFCGKHVKFVPWPFGGINSSCWQQTTTPSYQVKSFVGDTDEFIGVACDVQQWLDSVGLEFVSG